MRATIGIAKLSANLDKIQPKEKGSPKSNLVEAEASSTIELMPEYVQLAP
ncbi:MAG: hypothetical protein MI757_10185 [Pirellulales bacterium]|nr:hypothetical protein [Pirellulales bacterium]